MLIVAAVVVAGIAVLAVFPVEIDPINSSMGSIGYTHAVVRSNSTTDSLVFTADPQPQDVKLAAVLDVQFHRGTNPAPVTRSALEGFLSPATISTTPVFGPPAGTTPLEPGDECKSSGANRTMTMSTFAKLQIRDPNNAVLTWTSPQKQWDLKVGIWTTRCTGPSFGGPEGTTTAKYVLHANVEVDYTPGPYYFHEYGTYEFLLEIRGTDAQGFDLIFGKTSQTVTVAPVL
jgi:hypothetical protein